MVDTLILNFLLLFMAVLSVLEIFGKNEKRFASMIATLIVAVFLPIFIDLATLPNPNITGMLVASLGLIFGLVYFYESYTASGLILLYKIIKQNW